MLHACHANALQSSHVLLAGVLSLLLCIDQLRLRLDRILFGMHACQPPSICITVENTMQNAFFWLWLLRRDRCHLFSQTSYGFTRLWPSVLTVLAYGISFYLLSQTLKRMEIGVVYAIWSGAGTALMAVVGYWFFQESMSMVKPFHCLDRAGRHRPECRGPADGHEPMSLSGQRWSRR